MSMSDTDEWIEYGTTYHAKRVTPIWQNRRMTNMTIIKETPTDYFWEVYLDCGHSLIEKVSKDALRTIPLGTYRDCPSCMRKAHVQGKNKV